MNKASGEDGIPSELFQILKGDALKVLHSICQQILKTQQWLHIQYFIFSKEHIKYHGHDEQNSFPESSFVFSPALI